MSWLSPAEIGIVTGLLFAWPVLALAVSFRLFNFPDLTIEGSFPIGAAVAAVGIANEWPLAISVIAVFAAGALLGATTAFIHAYLHVNKFLAGILVVAMSYTLALRLMDGPNIGLIGVNTIFDVGRRLDVALSGLRGGTLLLAGGIVGMAALLILLLVKTPQGLKLRLAASNPVYGEMIGINTRWCLIAGLAMTNALAAWGGAMIAMYQGFADVGMGQGVLILALASMTIGERLLPQKRISIAAYVIFAAILGAALYQVLVAYALRLGLASTDLKLATAVFVLLVIAVKVRRRDDNFLETAG